MLPLIRLCIDRSATKYPMPDNDSVWEWSVGITVPMKRAYAQLCQRLEPEYFVTLATNDYGSLGRIRSLAASYCARMDRKLLGHEWHKRPAGERTDGIFFVEHTASHIHLHGLLRFPSGTTTGLEMTTGLIWKKLCPKGSVAVMPIQALSSLVDYCVKESRFSPDYSDDQIILVRELMSERSNDQA